MNTILSSLCVLPKLINGKVCIVHTNGNYELLNPTKHTTISDGFDPMDYSILISDKYPRCIVHSSRQEREHYLVNKVYKEYYRPIPYRIGDRIHIKSRRGLYRIVDIWDKHIVITCNRWQYEDNSNHVIPKEDFAALAGGIHNWAC